MSTSPELPTFDALRSRTGYPSDCSWGVWGASDTSGTLNLLSSDAVVAAARLVRSGSVVPLDVDLTELDPPMFGRESLRRERLDLGPTGSAHDEVLVNWNTQTGSQWDGFAHVEEPGIGSYNGLPAEDHGVGKWRRHGIVGRGVLADLVSWWKSAGRPFDPGVRSVIPISDVLASLRAQGTTVTAGDILLLRTGWLSFYRSQTPEQRRAIAAGEGQSAGLSASRETAAALWDLRISAVAADSPSLEAWPPELAGPDQPDLPERSLHRSLLVRLGMPIGEFWDLEELAAECANHDRYEFLLVSVPIALSDGVATPANAVAIF
jgi:kynurenine formamidase